MGNINAVEYGTRGKIFSSLGLLGKIGITGYPPLDVDYFKSCLLDPLFSSPIVETLEYKDCIIEEINYTGTITETLEYTNCITDSLEFYVSGMVRVYN